MTADHLLAAARTLCEGLAPLTFASPVTHVYNPLSYAWDMNEAYVRRYGAQRKRVVFLGMNPGPWGMAQTGVPFGEIPAVRDYLGLYAPIGKPENEHPKRPVTGLNCQRSEVSGKRVWGAISAAYPQASDFFAWGYIANYCPLSFMEASGVNRTPDKLPAGEREALYALCDQHLRSVVEALEPEWVIGIGGFAEARAQSALSGSPVRVGRILHPSPASPAANRGWAEAASAELQALGICPAPTRSQEGAPGPLRSPTA